MPATITKISTTDPGPLGPLWHDDSSPYRRHPLELRRKLEPRPLNSLNFPHPPPRRKAVCHPDRIHFARGYCFICYSRLSRSGIFKERPELRATRPL